MSADDVTVELDDYARDLLTTYARTSREIAELDALRVKARDQLMSFLAVRGGGPRVRGSINGAHVVTFTASESLRFDVRNFREDQPALYAMYAHASPRRVLSWVSDDV